MSIIDRILRAGEGRTLRRLQKIADQVEALAPDYAPENLTDEQLRAKTDEFKARLADGETLDDLMVEAFATVREAADRILGLRPFHVQVMGAAALHSGNIAEMKTGEGKTLVATMPAYLRALTGEGVHVVTVNDYLAEYQSEMMGRVYRFLGLEVGCVLSGQTPAERREIYNSDITYGTNNEFGFDYLRDNMAQRPEDMVQRGHNYVIVDEVDSILIDEARTPLIISGPAAGDLNHWYREFARIARMLERDVDYEVDEKKRNVGVTEEGIDKVEDQLGVDNLYEAANTPLIGFLNNSVRAKELFLRDRDYIVDNGEVLIVDEHTGRVLPGRRYNDGMHQAIEAKEGVEIKAENQTLATITLQNYFRLYPEGSRAGMTGTAETEAAEFSSTYKIGVVPIPTNMPMIRGDQSDLVYPTLQGKLDAIVADIEERHREGQPVLVGTASVESSELVSSLLREKRIPHQVLNAKQHGREAMVVAMAGRKHAVTVATNMAGRGTDIMLGGNSEIIAQANLKDKGLDPVENEEEYRAAWPEALEAARQAVAAEHDEVRELGGLYVLGTERHESRRIDNQLRGRSGRQGDPGESRFYLSMEDDLMRLFNQGMAQRIMSSGAYPEDLPLESRMVSRSIASAQSQVEARNQEIRKNVLKYDDVMTGQREMIYGERRRVMEGENLKDQIDFFIEEMVTELVNEATGDRQADEWDLPELWATLRGYYPVALTIEDLEAEYGNLANLEREALVKEIAGDVRAVYADVEEAIAENEIALAQLGEDPMRELERRVVLSTVDRLWREHLYEVDYLKEGIGLRSMGQRDPLIEYKVEAAQMFQSMMHRIREESVQQCFNFARQFAAALEKRQQAEEQAEASSGPLVGMLSDTQVAASAGTSDGAADQGETAESDAAQAGQAQGGKKQGGKAQGRKGKGGKGRVSNKPAGKNQNAANQPKAGAGQPGQAQAGQGANAGGIASIMGNVGRESQSQRLRTNMQPGGQPRQGAKVGGNAGGNSGGGNAGGGNRAQRRAAKKKRR